MMDEMDEVFETFEDVVAELWSSPLMNHKSPFDDYKDLYVGYERPTRIPVPISPASPSLVRATRKLLYASRDGASPHPEDQHLTQTCRSVSLFAPCLLQDDESRPVCVNV
ncbi:hypothetical protein RRG08_066997 [Elysia crispata]|uniref:Uncharacterized protein n=1 Tax=Elysia crispata TaxID=231223 RepID=A0AAE1DCH6_9GAST|nr:hypothetical protein RRG08_066997 [Elysia crispata]